MNIHHPPLFTMISPWNPNLFTIRISIPKTRQVSLDALPVLQRQDPGSQREARVQRGVHCLVLWVFQRWLLAVAQGIPRSGLPRIFWAFEWCWNLMMGCFGWFRAWMPENARMIEIWLFFKQNIPNSYHKKLAKSIDCFLGEWVGRLFKDLL